MQTESLLAFILKVQTTRCRTGTNSTCSEFGNRLISLFSNPAISEFSYLVIGGGGEGRAKKNPSLDPASGYPEAIARIIYNTRLLPPNPYPFSEKSLFGRLKKY